MRRFSLKVKLTVLYTVCMLCVIVSSLGILFSLSSRELQFTVQGRLQSRVQNSVKEIEGEDGYLDLDSDFYMLDRGVYLSIYGTDGTFLYGRIPYGFDEQPEISDGELREIGDRNQSWYVLDMGYYVEEYGKIFIRGIVSVTEAEESFQVTVRFAVILFPVLLILTAVVGYRMTRRALLPVKNMTATVQKIREERDLSRRVGVEVKKGKVGDEVTELAVTFDQMLEQVENAFKREKQFTSDVSHELRTPLGVILAQCDVLLDDANQDRDAVMLIRRKAGEMSVMISQLLFLSRAEEGRLEISRENLELSTLTELAADEAALLAEEKKIRVETMITPDIRICADETLYIRMLMNLLTNAVSYGKENGYIQVGLERQDEEVHGWVKDDGRGISSEDLPHIFERFYRGDKARSADGHSGLGLSMVKWIMEVHGGRIEVDSTLGTGSTFHFYFPEK